MAYNPCPICGKLARTRGNFNAHRIALCNSETCKRARKTALQKEKREQIRAVRSDSRKAAKKKGILSLRFQD